MFDQLEGSALSNDGLRLAGPYTDVQRPISSSAVGYPDWMRHAVARLNELRKLPVSWNSYGAQPIGAAAVDTAMALLRGIMKSATPAPFIGPTPDGSLQIEWHRHGIDLEIRIMSANKLAVTIEDARQPANDFDGEVSADFRPIVRALTDLELRAREHV